MEKQQFKEQLKKIRENKYELPNEVDLDDITLNMLLYIGDIDPELRDRLIYSTFYFWMLEKKYYSYRQLNQLLDFALDETHLFYGIGNEGDDSVFTRAFTVLLIPLLLEREKIEPYLKKEQLDKIKANAFAYFQKEKDYRGYVQSKGWADAISHGADALDAIAENKNTEKEELIKILELIKAKVCVEHYVYVNEEDERMTSAIMNVLNRGELTDNEIIHWIGSFGTLEKPKTHPNMHNFVVNVKGFLRSLYFRILKSEAHHRFLKDIEDSQRKISDF